MNRDLRNPVVAANWKMNVLPSEAVALTKQIYSDESFSVDSILFPPYTHLSLLKQAIKPKLVLGGQNCSNYAQGAHTSQISANMLKDLGCEYVLLGHSESRESNMMESDLLPAKIERALEAGLQIVYCCGESLELRESNVHLEFIRDQLAQDIFSQTDLSRFIIAYEPIWAIGTGVTASPEQAQDMHEFIREGIRVHLGDDAANQIRILYGGSVKSSNVTALASMPDIDGVLVGGASLIPSEMIYILKAFS